MSDIGFAGSSSVDLNRTGPVIDFTSLDDASLTTDLITYAQATWSDRWTDFNPAQFAIVFLKNATYIGDLTTFYLNAALRECNITTAQRRQHVLEQARVLSYRLASAGAANGYLDLVVYAINLPLTVTAAGFQVSAQSVVFQPNVDYTIPTSPVTNYTGPDGSVSIDNGDGTFTVRIGIIQGILYVNVTIATSDGSREQSYVLPNNPKIDGTLIVKVNGVTWTEVDTFTDSGPTDQQYRTETNDDDETTLYFGDGANGKIPPSTQTISATWKVGGGPIGNVGPGTVTTIVTPVTGVKSCNNAARMAGGTDAESIVHARGAVPSALIAMDRAVSIADYATIALASDPGVAKTMAREAQGRIVEVAVAPGGGGFASSLLKSTVAAYVNLRRSAGRRVSIIDPTYVPLSVSVELYASKTQVQTGTVANTASQLLLTPTGTTQQAGLFDFANVGFGGRDVSRNPQLTIENVYKTLEVVKQLGVQSIRVTKLTNKPFFKPIGLPVGNGGLDPALGSGTGFYPTINSAKIPRRQWRLLFTSSTKYNVYQRMFGTVTQLTNDLLYDDRQSFVIGPPIPVGAVINPNSRQSFTFPADSIHIPTPDGSYIPRLTSAGTGGFFGVAGLGDPYYVEFPAFNPIGAVSVTYVPDVNEDNGFNWIVGAGSTPFAAGDQFLVTTFQTVDDLILADDEIPSLSASDLNVNVRTTL